LEIRGGSEGSFHVQNDRGRSGGVFKHGRDPYRPTSPEGNLEAGTGNRRGGGGLRTGPSGRKNAVDLYSKKKREKSRCQKEKFSD